MALRHDRPFAYIRGDIDLAILGREAFVYAIEDAKKLSHLCAKHRQRLLAARPLVPTQRHQPLVRTNH
jgi:hypothetical protein